MTMHLIKYVLNEFIGPIQVFVLYTSRERHVGSRMLEMQLTVKIQRGSVREDMEVVEERTEDTFRPTIVCDVEYRLFYLSAVRVIYSMKAFSINSE